jgi:Clp amino terminal domain, pathogenicity island component
MWPRAAIQAWAAAHPDPGPVFTGPDLPPLFDHAPQLEWVIDFASDEAWALNHDSIDLDHLVLGMLHPKCPGAPRAVLESLGVRAAALWQAFIESMGDPYDTKPRAVRYAEPTQRALERANLEAARLADAEVTSEHVLLALASRWETATFTTGWLARAGITAEAVRQRVVDASEGAALSKPPMLLGPPPTDHPGLAAELDLAPNPLGHDPRRRGPWTSMAFDVPEDRPSRVGMLARQYFLDRDGYPVLTTDGRPVHIVVDERALPVVDEQGHERLGLVEVPEVGTVVARYEPS